MTDHPSPSDMTDPELVYRQALKQSPVEINGYLRHRDPDEGLRLAIERTRARIEEVFRNAREERGHHA